MTLVNWHKFCQYSEVEASCIPLWGFQPSSGIGWWYPQLNAISMVHHLTHMNHHNWTILSHHGEFIWLVDIFMYDIIVWNEICLSLFIIVYHMLIAFLHIIISLFPFNQHFLCFNPHPPCCAVAKKIAQPHAGSVGIPQCPQRSKTPRVPRPRSLTGSKDEGNIWVCVCVLANKNAGCWMSVMYIMYICICNQKYKHICITR